MALRKGENIMSETLLKVEDLEVYYGVIRALKGISFEVKKGEWWSYLRR